MLYIILKRVFRSIETCYRSQSLHSFFCRLSDSMDKIQICTNFLFQFKLGRKAAETARDINDAFGPGTTNERVAQRWFKKFRNGDESVEDADGRGLPTSVDNEHLKALIEADPRKTTGEVAVETEVDHSTVVCPLKQIGKSKKLDKWVSHELNDNKKNRRFEVSSTLLCTTKTTHFSSRLWRVMRSGSSTTTGDVRHNGWMPEKLHNTSRSRNCTKKKLWWLFGGLWPVSSITASWIRAKRLRRRSTTDKLTKCTRSSNVCARYWSIWRNQFSSMTMLARMFLNWPCRNWMNWATRLCLNRHIHRTSRPPIITFSSISTTSCAKNASKAEMMPNRPSMTSLLPDLRVSMLIG